MGAAAAEVAATPVGMGMVAMTAEVAGLVATMGVGDGVAPVMG